MKRYFECIKGPYNLSDTERVGIVSAEDWYKGIHNTIMQMYIRPDDFVVAKWFEYSDGEIDHAEGFVTIAICKELSDAEILIREKLPHGFNI